MEEKEEGKEESKSPLPQINWKKYELSLLRAVAASGAYLLTHTEGLKAWQETVKKFCTKDHVELELYWTEKGCTRRFSDKFWATYKRVTKWIGDPKSNKSTQSGDFNEIVKEVKELKRAIDEKEAEKLNRKETKNGKKARSEQITDVVMVMDNDGDDTDFHDHVLPNKLKRSKKDHKPVEGPWGREDRSRARKPTGKEEEDGDEDDIDSAIKQIAFGKSDKRDEALKAEPKMNDYARDKTIDDVFIEAKIKDNGDVREVLDMVGVELLINIYCSKNQNFCPLKFKEQMKEVGLPPIVGHQLYLMLSKWKNQSLLQVSSLASTVSSSSSSLLAYADDSTPITFRLLDPYSGQDVIASDGSV